MGHDGEVHKRGTSAVEVVEGAHLVQGVIKMGEIVRQCDGWHSRHDFLGYLLARLRLYGPLLGRRRTARVFSRVSELECS